MNYNCGICNNNSVNYNCKVCDRCVNHYGTLDLNGESMVFFIKDNIIFSDVNGVISNNRECTINDIPCYSSFKESKLVFIKILKKKYFKFYE